MEVGCRAERCIVIRCPGKAVGGGSTGGVSSDVSAAQTRNVVGLQVVRIRPLGFDGREGPVESIKVYPVLAGFGGLVDIVEAVIVVTVAIVRVTDKVLKRRGRLSSLTPQGRIHPRVRLTFAEKLDVPGNILQVGRKGRLDRGPDVRAVVFVRSGGAVEVGE